MFYEDAFDACYNGEKQRGVMEEKSVLLLGS